MCSGSATVGFSAESDVALPAVCTRQNSCVTLPTSSVCLEHVGLFCTLQGGLQPPGSTRRARCQKVQVHVLPRIHLCLEFWPSGAELQFSHPESCRVLCERVWLCRCSARRTRRVLHQAVAFIASPTVQCPVVGAGLNVKLHSPKPHGRPWLHT